MKKKKLMIGVVSSLTAFTLTACGDTNDTTDKEQNKQTEQNQTSDNGHENMKHSGSKEVPADLETAKNPTYKVGDKAIITAKHMEGMDGAEAEVVGAYDTTVYIVSYTPTNGGEPVKNHKWIIHEEIKDAGNEPLKSGTEVTLDADHMEGMKGAKAKIDSSEETTVYMVDYTPTTGGEKVTNHKWVTESELKAK